MQYGYNLAGQQTFETYPSGKVVSSAIDNYGVVQTIADSQKTYLNGVTLSDRGLPSQIALGNGNTETFSYNDRTQLNSQSLLKGSTVLQKYDYSYGTVDVSNGNVDATKNNSQLGKIESYIGTTKQWSQRFSYDELGRLSESREYKSGDNSHQTYKQHFDFDRFGNLYRKAANNPTSGQENPLAYTPIEEDTDINKAKNQLASSSTTYDEAGEVTTDNKFRTMGFAYDANGRMVKATKTSVPDAWTVYDGLGNRVATKVNDAWQYSIYDAFGKLVAEYGVANPASSGTKYVQQDWQGSVRTITGNTGLVVGRTDYQALGEEIGSGVGLRTTAQGYVGTSPVRQGYGLTEKDDATGLDHAWYRKNETRSGRWTSIDRYLGSMSIADPQSFNRYAYVQNDPINAIDPSGLAIPNSLWDVLWKVGQGLKAANDALKSSLCRNFLRGKGKEDPRKIFGVYQANGNITVGTRYSVDGKMTNFYSSNLGAVTAAGGGPGIRTASGAVQSAPHITINLHGTFFSLRMADLKSLGSTPQYSGLSEADMRGLHLLHEFAHAQDVIPLDDGNTPLSMENTLRVKKMCFSGLSRIFRDSEQPLQTSPVGGGEELMPQQLLPYLHQSGGGGGGGGTGPSWWWTSVRVL